MTVRWLSGSAVVLVILLVIVVQPVGLAAPVPPAAVARIESFAHDARGPLNAGDRLGATLRGTARGVAYLHIAGVATHIAMQEARPGLYLVQPAVYSATYAVQPDDQARNAAVLATLSIDGQDTVAFGSAVTVDPRPPIVVARFPAAGGRLANARPNIALQFMDSVSDVDPRTVRLMVNGADVTARLSVTDTVAAYNPPAPFRPGPVHARVSLADRNGNVHRSEWTFMVEPGDGLINSVTVNPTKPLRRGDLLTVVVSGAPGGTATFAIAGLSGKFPLRESPQTPGLYFGSLEAVQGRQLAGAGLLVSLTLKGRTVSMPAAIPVTLMTAPPEPLSATVSPERVAGSGGGGTLRATLQGRSGPGYRVIGRLLLTSGASDGERELMHEFSAVSSRDGTWQAVIGPVPILRGARYTASMTAVDPGGQRTAPLVIDVAP
jgi:hypothetical protein